MQVEMQTPFAALLRDYRRAAGLTQEALAEQAGLSVRGLQALERGANRPQRDTLRRLVAALGLAGAERARFVAAALAPASAPLPVPPAPPEAPTRSRVPAPLTSLVGREREEAAVTHLLRQTGARLLTLTGPGGVGKTRLALRVAAALEESYAAGVAVVELAPLREAGLVVSTVAQALGLRDGGGQGARELLLSALRERELLLVLDNCEHLPGLAPLLVALLAGCPGLVVLATSRKALRLPGEQRFAVPPLAVPAAGGNPDPLALGQVAAVRLFVQRAQAVRPEFALSEENAGAVAAISRRLDGLPLALELAAARVASLPVAAIAARLDDRFKLLTTGPRTAPARQQTLRGTLDWSWELLAPRERALLGRLAAFAGGWTLEAAAAVCVGMGGAAGPDAGAGAAELDEWDVLDGLEELVSCSLVQVSEAGGAARYALLESVREYAALHLGASGETAAVRDRHLAWCLGLAAAAAPALRGSEQQAWLERLEAEHDNLRAALAWSLREGGDPAPGLRLAGALTHFWRKRGHFREGQAWLEEALALYRRLGDQRGIARTLDSVAQAAQAQGDYPRAATLLEEALALFRAVEDRWGVANTLNLLGWVTYLQGDYPRAVALLEEALARFRELGDRWGIANALVDLGWLTLEQGEYPRAAALHEEGLTLFRGLGDWRNIANVLVNLGWLALLQGDFGRAAASLEESLRLSGEVGARDVLAEVLECLASLAAVRGQLRRAARLAGASEALREALGARLPPSAQVRYARVLQDTRLALGAEAFAAAWAAGRAMSQDEVLAFAGAAPGGRDTAE